jgi:hypothetical protein
VLSLDLLLQVHVLRLQLVLQALDFRERLAQPLVRLLTLEFGAGACRKRLQHRQPQRILRHRLVVHQDHVADDAARRVPERNSEIALGVHGRQERVLGKELLDVVGVQACLAGGDLHARGVGQVVFEPRREAGAHPDGAGARPVSVQALGHIDTPHLQRFRQVLHEGAEERGAGHRGGAVHDGAQQFLCAALGVTATAHVPAAAPDRRHQG